MIPLRKLTHAVTFASVNKLSNFQTSKHVMCTNEAAELAGRKPVNTAIGTHGDKFGERSTSHVLANQETESKSVHMSGRTETSYDISV